jgi:ABC-2 type transport system ATP-binding protein
MIKFENISKSFKSDFWSQHFHAIKDLSFEIPEGSMVGFLGANGAGKTTSLKIIMDFIRPTSGRVLFSEKLGNSKIEAFKNIGYLPERPYFYPNLKGEEFLTFLGLLSELKKTEISERIKYWAPRFKMDFALDRELKTYSKGMLQRIGFMSTILHDPKMIILDEPLSGLDPIGRKEMKDVIIEVHKAGKTVFFSSHIVSDIEEICDRVIFLKEGELVFDGSVQKILGENLKSNYSIKFQTENKVVIKTPYVEFKNIKQDTYSVVVNAENKILLLEELLELNLDIKTLEQEKISLEEIFYKLKR